MKKLLIPEYITQYLIVLPLVIIHELSHYIMGVFLWIVSFDFIDCNMPTLHITRLYSSEIQKDLSTVSWSHQAHVSIETSHHWQTLLVVIAPGITTLALLILGPIWIKVLVIAEFHSIFLSVSDISKVRQYFTMGIITEPKIASNNSEENKADILICDCNSPDHQLVVRYEKDDYSSDVYIEIHLTNRRFFSRLKYAIKYLFGYKSRYGAWDEFILNPKDAPKIREIAEFLGSSWNKYPEKWPSHKDLVLCWDGSDIIPAIYYNNNSFKGFYPFTTHYSSDKRTAYHTARLKSRITGVLAYQDFPTNPKE